jgi:hypothetical protein
MWNELGRAMRSCWAAYIWGAPIVATQHIDYGSTVITFQSDGRCTWFIPPSMN